MSSKIVGFACYETIEIINPNPTFRQIWNKVIRETLDSNDIEAIKAFILRIATSYSDALPILEEIIYAEYPQHLKLYNQIVLIS